MTLDFWTVYLKRFPLCFGTESIALSIFEISKAKQEFDILGETLLDLSFLQLRQIFRWLIEFPDWVYGDVCIDAVFIILSVEKALKVDLYVHVMFAFHDREEINQLVISEF